MVRLPLAACAIHALCAAPAVADDLPRSLDGVGLGMTLNEARTAAIAADRAFTGCDTVLSQRDGQPLLTLCSHQGEAKGTDVAVGKTDLQVWADGAEQVFAVVRAEPLSCRPEEQVAVVRSIKDRYGRMADWVPPWSWRGATEATELLVDVLNAEAPCGVTYEVRDVTTHAAVAEALRAEME